MWFLFQIAIMTLIIGSNGAYHWAGDNSGFAVPLLAAFNLFSRPRSAPTDPGRFHFRYAAGVVSPKNSLSSSARIALEIGISLSAQRTLIRW